ncbi:glutaredoxin 3 [Magnetococcus marinus MC-1]|uniref:Glutaredoxin n=1 Tax=Magnetococcus marinus (strain ATCC BAA-1437 / JCM 17883 / MC-1) TaxID=156889 RepID=A0L7H0_MAGMM|nr:glutaredoxin 3 [Magnetococcus marinus]ABK43913.1 glutaredoxin 3 [Magnetococcus marinus MC-1]
MADITIYSTTICPFCVRAKQLFKKKGVDFTEINLDKQPDRRDEMLAKSGGRRTVPQIFIGDRHVGGCDDLYELELDGELDPLLGL